MTVGTLFSNILEFPAEPANNAQNFNTRQSNVLYIKGVKICRYFDTSGMVAAANPINGPIQCNWCLLQSKQPIKDITTPTAFPSEWLTAFWRDNTDGTDKSRDWVTYPSTTATADWQMGMNCSSLNPNGSFRILTRQKFKLYPNAQNPTSLNVATNLKTWRVIDKYFKINKAVNFTSNTGGIDQYNNYPIYELFWYNTLFPGDLPVGDNTGTVLKTQGSNTVYYSEKRGCC